MQSTSNGFKTAIKGSGRRFKAYVEVNGTRYDGFSNLVIKYGIIQGNDIGIGNCYISTLSMDFKGLSNTAAFLGQRITPFIGLSIDGSEENIEYLKMGVFNIYEAKVTDKSIKISANDNMQLANVGFFSNLKGNQKISALMNEQCKKLGINFSGGADDVAINVEKLEGLKTIEAMSLMAAYCGKNALANRDGNIEFKWFVDANYGIGPSRYTDPLTVGEKDMTINGMSCSVDKDTTITAGTQTGKIISINNQFMTQERLDALYNRIKSFSFRTCNLSYVMGDPSIEVGDIVTVEDKAGKKYKVPVFTYTVKFTGGCQCTIQCDAVTEEKEKAQSNGGFLTQKVERNYTEYISTKELLADTIIAYDGKFTTIETDFLQVNGNITALSGEFGTLESDLASFKVTNTEQLNAITAKINTIETVDLTAMRADISEANIGVANINTLLAGTVTAGSGQYIVINSQNAQFENAFFKRLVSDNVVAADIFGERISTNQFKVGSDNGNLLITDNTIQIKDANRQRVQIGKDASGDYNIYVWDVTGKLMFDATGVTANGIQKPIIRDSMVAADANISGDKINITSVITKINDNSTLIEASHVKYDGKSLDVAFNSLQTYVNTMEIGGTNIATGTNRGVEGWYWSLGAGGYAKTEVEENGIRCVKFVRDAVTQSGWSFIAYSNINRVKYQPNKQYSITFDVKSSKVASFRIWIAKSDGTAWLNLQQKTNIDTVADEWTRVSVVITTVSPLPTATGQVLYMIPSNSNPGTSYMFRNLMISEGNKPVAWSPAPEDLDGQITTLTESIKSQSTQINVAQGQIGTLITDVSQTKSDIAVVQGGLTTATGSISTLQSNYSKITQDINGLSSTVGSHTSSITTITGTANQALTNANNANSKIDGLEIGGRNLIRNSNFKDSYKLWVNVGNNSFSAKTDSVKGMYLHVGTLVPGDVNTRFYPDVTNNFKHKTGQWYALSFDAKSSVNGTILESNNGGSAINLQSYTLTTAWKRYTAIYQATTTASLTFWLKAANTDADITNIKMENGTKVTDYTEAPEDVDSKIDGIQIGGRNLALDTSIERLNLRNCNYFISSIGIDKTKPYTVSFYFKANKAGTYSVYLNDDSGASRTHIEFGTIAATDTTYHYYSFTAKPTGTITVADYIRIRIYGNADDLLGSVKQIKLEEGNKPTTWSPAPEDIDNRITVEIKTVTDKQVEFESTLNGFKSTVSETYTTKVDFNNLQVGGRNLLLDSTGNLNKYWTLGSVQNGGLNGNNSVGIQRSGFTGSTRIMNSNSRNSVIELSVGTEYTLSAWIKLYSDIVCDDPLNTGVFVRFTDASGGNLVDYALYLTASTVKDKWIYYKETFKLNKATTTKLNAVYVVVGKNGHLEACNIKLEKGSKATDWSPAPEDVDDSIATVDGKFANYSTTTQMNTAIDQSASQITLAVSKTYTTITDFNNLEIGGRNLLTKTDDYSTSKNVGTLLDDKYNGLSVVYYKNIDTTTSTYKDMCAWLKLIYPLPDTEYTLSFFAKGTGKFNSYFYGSNTVKSGISSEGKAATASDGSIQHTLTSTWKRYWITWKTRTDLTADPSHIIVGRTFKDTEMWIAGCKFEQGNKATAFTPSPEDVDNKFANYSTTTQMNTAIELTKSDITQTVSDNYKELKGENTLAHALSMTATGDLVRQDPMFLTSQNGVEVYNNSSNGTVTVTRIAKPSDCPTTSGYCMQIKHTGVASPNHGGFYQIINSRANAVFVVKYLIKLPVGYKLMTASNAMGAGYTDKFLTSTEGTGKWEEYVRMVECGATGSFSTGGHLSVSGNPTPTAAAPLTWYLGAIYLYDVSNAPDMYSRLNTAESKLTATSLVTTISTAINAGTAVTTTKFTMDATGLHVKGGGFDISNNAGTKVLYADTSGNLTLNGEVNATAGTIGGWAISGSRIYNNYIPGVADGGRTGISPGYNTQSGELKPYDGLCFWAGAYWKSGSSDLSSVATSEAPFRVYANGDLYATKANISGTITGSTIIGSTITGGSITSNTSINVATDLRVGSNIYVGSDQDIGTTAMKRILFTSTTYIARLKQTDYEQFQLYSRGIVRNVASNATGDNSTISAICLPRGFVSNYAYCQLVSTGAGGTPSIQVRGYDGTINMQPAQEVAIDRLSDGDDQSILSLKRNSNTLGRFTSRPDNNGIRFHWYNSNVWANCMDFYKGKIDVMCAMYVDSSLSAYSLIDNRTGWACTSSSNVQFFRHVQNERYLEIGTYVNGAFGVYYNVSDISFKKDIEPTDIQDALSIVNRLEHFQFNWKDTGSHVEIGYIANHVKEVMPGLVFNVKQPDGSDQYNINQTTLMPVITKAIQELDLKVEYIEDDVEKLKRENELLKGRIECLQAQLNAHMNPIA